MRKNVLLMTPGPTNIPSDVCTILRSPMPHHRSQAFAQTFQTFRSNIQKIVSCKDGETVVFASSGTGSMEAAIVNFNRQNDHILVIETGYFGTRFVEIAQQYQLRVTRLSAKVGEVIDVSHIQKTLLSNPDIKTVYVTHHDTSTGICNDIQAIGELMKQFPEVLYVIDSISGMIMHEVDMDAWGIDVVLGASQKGFMVPPGLAFLCLSEKAIKRTVGETLPRFYFNIAKQLEMLSQNQTFATPTIDLIYAMTYMTSKILKEGLSFQYELYAKRRMKLETLLIQNGLTPVITDEMHKGNVVVPVYVPPNIQPQDVVNYIERHANIMIIGGYGALKDTTVRIGVLGPITTSDIEDTVRALMHAIETLQKEVIV